MSIAQITADLRSKGYTLTPTRYSRVFVGGIGRGAERIWRPITIDDMDGTDASAANERTTWYTTQAACRDLIDDSYVIGYFGEEDAAAMGAVVLPAIPTVAEMVALHGKFSALADHDQRTCKHCLPAAPLDVEAETAQWSQPASEQTIDLPGLGILATLNADGTVTVDIDANKGTVQRITINDKEVF